MTDTLRPRRRRWFLLGVGILLVLTIAWQWWSMSAVAEQGRRDLAAVRAEIDAADPRWRWHHLEEDRPDFPEAADSFALISTVEQQLQTWRTAQPRYPNVPGVLLDANSPPEKPQPNELLSAGYVQSLVEDAIEGADLFALARALRDRPRGRTPIMRGCGPDNNPPHLSTVFLVTTLLETDVERQLHLGHTHTAVEDIHALLHAGAVLRDDGFEKAHRARLMHQVCVVRAVERLLALSEPTEDDLAALRDHLAAEAAEPILRTALRGQRAGWNEVYEGLQAGTLPLGQYTDAYLAPSFCGNGRGHVVNVYKLGIFYRNYLAEDHAAFLREATAALTLAERSPQEQAAAWPELARRCREQWPQSVNRFVFARWAVPQAARIGAYSVFARSLLNCARVALAVESFRRAHRRWPAALTDLVPDYLSAVPIDPYSGEPLILRATAQGLAIHATGPSPLPYMSDLLSRSDQASTDAERGVRLWNPEHRRLPSGRDVWHTATHPIVPFFPESDP
jgi:hypothetical protein